MSDVTLSSAVRNNLLSLQSTADLMSKTQERLATGLKVNSALDNPTNFFNASALNSRANDLGRLLDGVSNATQTLEAADNGIEAITKLVESAQATARQAQQTSATVETTTGATAGTTEAGAFSAVNLGAGSPASAGEVSFSFGSATGAFDGVDDAITFDITVDGGGTQNITIDQTAVAAVGNNDNTIDDAAEFVAVLNNAITGATATESGGTISITSDTTGASSSVTIANLATVDTNASGFTDNTGIANGTDTGSPLVAADSVSFDLAVDGGSTQSVTIDAATVTQYNTDNSTSLDASALTAENVAALVNDQITGATAAVDADSGNLTITSGTTGTSSSVAISSFSASVTGGSTGLANGTDTGAAESTTSGVNPERAEFISQYNEIVGQINELAEDAGFNGVNLLNGDDLSVTFNEDGSSSLDITGVSFDSAGLGLSELGTTAFDTDSSIDTVLTSLDSAVSSLRSQASEFGSNLSIVETREDFTKSMINTLETGAANLTLADTNEEGANLLALQTRQSLSSTSLSLASQADQNVLRLL
jgi:flagellin